MSAPAHTLRDDKNAYLRDRLGFYSEHSRAPALPVEGKLTQMTGLALVAAGCQASVGNRCRVISRGDSEIEAEVVGFANDNLYLMPIGRIHGLNPGARVIPIPHDPEIPVGDALLGRVTDATGKPIDGLGELKVQHYAPLVGMPINPLQRKPISRPLDVGVRVINSLLTVGRGQRLGLFAGSGVGKSVLLGQMTRFTEADVVVVGLIGERGREVREFVERILGPQDLKKAVVVATPADDPPLMRLHGAWRATTIAEYFRDQGHNVLLLMDSISRFAQAQRELALAIGEPPVTRGYPPSVFAQIPQLVERAGNGTMENKGSITAFYTVLAEGDDPNDPIVDAVRSILDGHIVLSRSMAEAGIYPAVNPEASISRVMTNIMDQRHVNAVTRFKQLYSTYEQNRDLINVGAYHAGSDREIDQAIAYYPYLQAFIKQGSNEKAGFSDSVGQLYRLTATEEEMPS